MKIEDSITSAIATLEQELQALEQSQASSSSQPAQALWQILRANTNPAGFSSFASPSSSLTQLPNVTNMPYYRQQGNACGTTTLAEIMSYLGVNMTQADVDNGIRRMNTFTAPNDMIDFARSHGLEAEGYNNASFDQIKSMIDAGCPVQAMVDGNDSVSVSDAGSSGNFSVSGLHYIAITGYGTDPATGEQYITYHDPNRKDGEQRMSVSDFEKMWSNVHYDGIPTGFNNYFIAYGKPGTNLPPGNDDGVQGTNGLLDGITNVTNGLNRIYSPDNAGDFVHGLFEFPSGIVQGIGGFFGGVAELGANWLRNEVKGIPVLGNIVDPIADVVAGAGAALGDLADGVGKAGNDIGGAFGSLFNGDLGGFASGLGNAAVDAGKGIVNAIGDAASAVGNAVSDFFSGW
jgi:uncharacterized protein YvpB